MDILALSGGGQWGAFGAGFLAGWTEHGDRPEFRVVSGTSTGSMISSFAFLGPEFDDELRDAYLTITGDSDVFKKRNMLWAILFKDALSDTKPLKARLERSITDEMLAKIKAEAARDRRLVVGAVDLVAGDFVGLDLTRLAQQPNPRADYVEALLSSTAIPVKFPPRYKKHAVYADGGARRNIFTEVVLDEVRRSRDGRDDLRGGTIFAIVNGVRGVRADCVRNRIPSIAGRSVSALMDEAMEGNLNRIYRQSQAAKMKFKVVSIDPKACPGQLAASQENQFDPQLMKCLYKEGYDRGKAADQGWIDDPMKEKQ